MLKKTITYKDLDGNDVTEDFYFNLNKAEVAKMELSEKGGFAEHLRKIIQSGDGKIILDTFEDLIRRSVGKRHEDGKQFIKNEEVTNAFMQSEAYSEMFLEMVTNAQSGAEFIKAVMPADMVAQVEAGGNAIENVQLPGVEMEKKFDDPNWVPDQADLAKMTPEQIQRAFARKVSTPQS